MVTRKADKRQRMPRDDVKRKEPVVVRESLVDITLTQLTGVTILAHFLYIE